MVIDLIVTFSEFDNRAEAYQYLEESQNKVRRPKYSPLVLESAYSDVYGYTEGYWGEYCLSKCPRLGGINMISAPDHFEVNNHIKCYECNQLYVHYVTTTIIEGSHFSEIDGLPNYLAFGRHMFRTGFSIERPSDDSTEVIQEQILYDPMNQVYSFGNFLGSFLTKHDSNGKHPLYLRLKKCDPCGKFKIGKRRVKKGQNSFCRPECKDRHHREIRKETKYHTGCMRTYPRG